MKVRKAVKKIIALGVGATMLGATLLGAAAADLGDFPGNFIDNGNFNGRFVVGASAATEDVIGINGIVSAVQAKAVKQTWVELGTSETEFSAEDGVFLATGSDVLRMGNDLTEVDSSFDDDDFPTLLASGVVEDDDYDDEEYDYDQELTIDTDTEIDFDLPSDDDNGIEPVALLKFSDSNDLVLTYTVDFDDSDVVFGSDGNDDEEGFQNSESIVMLGTKFTFKKGLEADSDDITLYKSSVSQTLGLGETVEVDMDGESYVIELIAINSDSTDAKATIMVNGDSETMEEGDQKTVGGLDINVDDIQINTIGEESGVVRVYLGADEVVLSVDTNDITVNGEDLDGVEFALTDGSGGSTNLSEVSSLTFTFMPNDFDLDPNLDELQVGESFVDPLFGAIKYQFVGSTVDELMESEDVFEIDGTSNELDVSFVDIDGNEVEVTLFEYDDAGDDITTYDGDYVVHTSVIDGAEDLEDLDEDEFFILADENAVDQEDSVTTALVVDKVHYDSDDSDSYVRFENLNTGDTFEVKTGDEILETNRYAQVGEDDLVNITSDEAGTTLVAGENQLRTLNGVLLTITADDTNVSSLVDVEILFEEDDTAVWDDDDYTAADVTFTITGDSGDDEFNINADGTWVQGAKSMDDYEYYMSEIGTYGVLNTEDDNKVTMYTPASLVEYNVWVGPSENAASTGTTGNGYWQTEVVPIPPTASVLDTSVSDPTAENLIVVGGPCANSVAAALLGNPANCVEGFVEGKAKILLFDDTNGMASGKIALLVAGYTAADTTRATTVVAEYEDWDLSGKELEVTGTSSSDINVGVPVVEETTPEVTE